MQIMVTQKEKQIAEQIEKKFQGKYKLDWRIDTISIFINENCSLTLDIKPDLTFGDDALLLSTQDGKQIRMRLDDIKEAEYLDTLEDILINLDIQLSTFKKYIKDFITELKEDNIDYIIDLNYCNLYIDLNSDTKVIIAPVLDLTNDKFVTSFIVNDIHGNYPMKNFTTLSYSDLMELVLYFS